MRVLEPGDPGARSPDFLDWLRDHGIRPEDTYKVEVGAKRVIAYRYKRGGDGGILIKRDGDNIELEVLPPLSVPMKRPSPV